MEVVSVGGGDIGMVVEVVSISSGDESTGVEAPYSKQKNKYFTITTRKRENYANHKVECIPCVRY